MHTLGVAMTECQSCGISHELEEPLLLLRSSTIAPVIAVLPGEGADPTQALNDLYSLAGGQVQREPVLAPRILLPTLLERDLDADASDPAGAEEEVCAAYGQQMAKTFGRFLVRAYDHPEFLMHGLATAGGPNGTTAWIEGHPFAMSSGVLDRLAQLATQADTSLDGGLAQVFRNVRDLVISVRSGTSPSDAVRAYWEAGERNSPLFAADVERLRLEADSDDPRTAIPALRAMLQRLSDGQGDERRNAAGMLASHLIRSHPAAWAEAEQLLEQIRDDSPARDAIWAQATGNLANILGDRRRPDWENHWQRAVSLAREPLEVDDLAEEALAIYETNLGLLFLYRPGGCTSDQFGEAIAWLRRGLARRSPENNVEDWAYSKINLGLVHRYRNGDGDLAIASRQYTEAIHRLEGTTLTRLRTYARLNLADALLEADPPRAEEALRLATDAGAEARHDPFLLGWSLNVIGDASASLYGNQTEASMDAWREGIDTLDPVRDSELVLRIAGKLAESYATSEDWDQLAEMYGRVLPALDKLYTVQATKVGRFRILTNYARFPRWAAYAFARAGRVDIAIETLEHFRTRELEAGARHDMADLSVVDSVDPALAERYRAAVAAYQALALSGDSISLEGIDVVTPATRDSSPESAAVAARRSLDQTIAEIRSIPGLEQFLITPSPAALIHQVDLGQVIYMVSAPGGTFVLRMISRQQEGTVAYDAVHVDIGSGQIARMLLADPDTAEPGLVAAQQPSASSEALERAILRLGHNIRAILRPLADLIAEVAPKPSVLVLTGLLGLIPLQSLPIDNDENVTIDDLAQVHLAPSLGLYIASRRRAARPSRRVFVGIANTDPDYPLPGADAEVAAIAALPQWDAVEVASGSDGTLEWINHHAPRASHLHFACHGSNDLASPEGSYLVLGNGERLTYSALVEGRSLQARLATASACQSGQYDAMRMPDEHLGIAAGLLQAGSACVVVSLWPVSDEATALLMTRFYELLGPSGGVGNPQRRPQEKLREARLWLRHLTNEERDQYLDTHPTLAEGLRARGLPAIRTTESSRARGPYQTTEHWGAFVAYGY